MPVLRQRVQGGGDPGCQGRDHPGLVLRLLPLLLPRNRRGVEQHHDRRGRPGGADQDPRPRLQRRPVPDCLH